MGANAQTSVPAFTAGQVLTAQQQTEINTGIPVFATTTTRDAAFGGTGEKVLAEGQMAYIENIAGSSAVQYYDGSAWQTLVGGSGLTLIKTQTIGSGVSSVTVTDAFSSTYDTYKITVNGGVASGVTALRFQLGTTTGYYGGLVAQVYNGGYGGLGISNQTTNLYAGYGDATSLTLNMDVMNPNLAEKTYMSAFTARSGDAFGMSHVEDGSTTQHTAFTISTASGTMTGGTIRVYGFANS
jgi:hypothetical protein